MDSSAPQLADVQRQMVDALVDDSDGFWSRCAVPVACGLPADFTRFVATEDEEEYWRCNHCYHPLIWDENEQKPKGHKPRVPHLNYGPRCFENGELHTEYNRRRLKQRKPLAQTFEELVAE